MHRYFILAIIYTIQIPILYSTSGSVVYNLRISATTRGTIRENDHRTIVATTLFDQQRVRYNGTHQTFGGALVTLINTPSNLFLRLETAVGHIAEQAGTTKRSRTQLDDLLFTAGYRAVPNDHTRATFSGLLGLPTHGDNTLNAPQFGIAHVAFGVQADASYAYSPHHHHSFFIATRFIRFLPRTVDFKLPLNLCTQFDLDLGNTIDMLVAHHSSYNKHQCELGHNATFAFGASLYPPPILPALINTSTFIRSSVYISYGYGFKAKHFEHGITFAFSYGKDHRPRLLGFRNIYALWATWGIKF